MVREILEGAAGTNSAGEGGAVDGVLTDEQALELALVVIRDVDYDIWKDYQPETAEMPEDLPQMRRRLVEVVQAHLAGLKVVDETR